MPVRYMVVQKKHLRAQRDFKLLRPFILAYHLGDVHGRDERAVARVREAHLRQASERD